jgi:hypothetical protein
MINLKEKISNFFNSIYYKLIQVYNTILNCYNTYKTKLFLVDSIRSYDDNQINNIYVDYLKSFFVISNLVYKLIEIKLQKDNINRKIILENKKMSEIRNIIKLVSFNNNDLIPSFNNIFIHNINLINNQEEKKQENIQHITNLCITEYVDNDEQYSHKIENILKFNKVSYFNNSKININYINMMPQDFSKFGKIISKELDFKNIKNLHINKVIELL